MTVKLGTGRGGRWGNSSGSCIPSAHRAISGAARGRPKQELIRGAVKTKRVDLAESLGWKVKEKLDTGIYGSFGN